jgi:hypothetical protein
MFWAVFHAVKQQQSLGYAPGGKNPIGYKTTLVWSGLDGVFKTDSSEEACKAAAKKNGTLGVYVAIECLPWGAELFDVEGVEEVGTGFEDDMTRMEKLERRTRELEKRADIPF